VNQLPLWKILGISIMVHVLLILCFRGFVIFSHVAPTFPTTRFMVIELPGEIPASGAAASIDRLYQVPTESVDTPAEPVEVIKPSLAETRLLTTESLFERYVKASKEGINFFGLKPPNEKGSTVFLIDISGSMLQHSGGSSRLDQAYDQLKQALACMGSGQRFNIVLFATRMDSFAPEPVAATRENIIKAYRYLDSEIDCGGSTNLLGGLQASLAMRPDHLIVLSDGIPTSSEPSILLTETKFLRQKILPAARIYSIGFYIAAGSPEELFLTKLAKQNNGAYLRWNPKSG